MYKIKTDSGTFRLAPTVAVHGALLSAVEHLERYHFKPIRPDLLPHFNHSKRVYYRNPNASFKREELSGVNATINLQFEVVACITKIDIDDGEPLRIYRPYVDISWTTSNYTPEQAVLAGRIIGDAGIASIGLPGAMGGTWSRSMFVYPSIELNDDQLDILMDLIGANNR